jgi:hypothetical protein
MAEALEKALPELREDAKFESLENMGSETLITQLQQAVPVITKERETSGVMVAFQDATSSQLQTFLAQQAAAKGKLDQANPGGLEAKFDSKDMLGWFGSFFTWWKKIKPHAWPIGDAKPADLPDVATVGLLADWGTGMYGAIPCAQNIAAAKPYLVMHLGDVYYSGESSEMQKRFLDVWPKVEGAINRGLNGNHEMYTGGQAYFDLALKQFGQSASYFAFQNKNWLLVALDTAYQDQDLFGDQVSWLDALISQAGERKIVLFSHHQPYSLIDTPAARVVAKLQKYLDAKRIYAWYFGHEHRCLVYDLHPTWSLLGRCIGHSGFPEFRKAEWGPTPAKVTWLKFDSKGAVPAAVLLDGPNSYIKGHESEYLPHGYVTLEFDNQKLRETFYLADGTSLKTQEIA